MPDDRAELTEIKIQLATISEKMVTIWKRVDEQIQLTKSVQELALSTQAIAIEIKQLRTDHETMRRDVDELKSRPAKRWESIIGALLTAVVGFVVSYIIFGGR